METKAVVYRPLEEQIIDAVQMSTVDVIEDFLGCPLTADIVKDLGKHVRKAAREMPLDEFRKKAIRLGFYGIDGRENPMPKHTETVYIKPSVLARVNSHLRAPHGADTLADWGHEKDTALWNFSCEFDNGFISGPSIFARDDGFYCDVALIEDGPDIVEECGYCKDNLLWDFAADFDASTTAGIIVATDDVSFYCYVILLDDNACEAGVINDVSKLEYGQTFQFSLNDEPYEVVVKKED